MRAAGRGWLAVVLAVLVLVGAGAAERLGAKEPPAASPSAPSSATWLCPHGGGEGWRGTIEIANPGTTEVDARLTSVGSKNPRRLDDVTVPPGASALVSVPADTRNASTLVDVFGGWAGVGWVVQAGGAEDGMGADPCTSAPGGAWAVVDAATTQQMRSFLVVMNPFAIDAVIDVALFLSDQPPVRNTNWTDLPIPAGHSVALSLGSRSAGALGEPIVGAQVTASRGRVAVGSLAIRAGGGVRSVLASAAPATRWILPVAPGAGRGTLSLLLPGEEGIRFGATQLSADTAAQTAGNLTVVRQGGTSTLQAPVTTSGPSAVVVTVTQGGAITAGFREVGEGRDDASTGGAATPEAAWVVPPTAFGGAPAPSIALVNDGDASVTASLTKLGPDGPIGAPVSLTVPPGRTAGAPRAFLRANPAAAVLVQADGPIVALGAGVSGPGQDGWYAMTMGVPVPAGVSLPAAP